MRMRKSATAAGRDQQPAAQSDNDLISQPTQPCSYNPKTYHSFASIEKRRCSFCGMRGPKIVLHEPCDTCARGVSGSHISSSRGKVDTHKKHSAINSRHLSELADSSSSVLLGPRPVTPERAAKRIGNPPRVSRLPPGIIRLPVATPGPEFAQQKYSTSRSPSRLGIVSPDVARYAGSVVTSTEVEAIAKPASPKLHHLHGLPQSEQFPFVRKNEISKHAIALRAGSRSPLTRRSDTPKDSSSGSSSPDYSKTVYYGGRISPSNIDRSTASDTHVTTVVAREVRGSESPLINFQALALDTVLAGSEVYRKRSPQQHSVSTLPEASTDARDSNTTFESQNTRSTRLGDMRLELKGGNTSNDASPRLRGGGRHDGPSTNSLSFKLKRWLLTCHGPCPDYSDTDSDADLPPPRVVSPERVVKARQKMNGRASLPAHLTRGAQRTSLESNESLELNGLAPPTSFTTTISGPPKRSRLSRISSLGLSALSNSRSESPISQPAHLTPSKVLEPPYPHLRGGAESPERVPPNIFWLAGGTGRKPITFSSWKNARPKQRMGGLFGMAVFGERYGQDYRVDASVEVEGDVSCSASVSVVVGDAVDVNKGEQGTDDLSSTSAPSPASISSPSSASSPTLTLTHRSETAVPEPVIDSTEKTKEGTSDPDSGPQKRAFTFPPSEPSGGVPLCSGALPVEPNVEQETANLARRGDW